MRKRGKSMGSLLQFMLVLFILALAIVVAIGIGQSIWSLAQEDGDKGKGNVVVSQKSEPIDSTIKVQEKNDLPEELLELLEKNPETEEFVLNYPLKKNQTFEIDLTDYENTDSVPLLLQWDERWGYTIYGSNVMGLTGCGPTCLSMVCLHLLRDASYTPRYVADFAEENGYYVEGSGSAWTLISKGGETLGLDVTEIPLDENRMMKNLELGNPIICIMGPGDFTTTGHFIVLAGCKDGKFIVNDPNSKTNSERLWTYEEISGQIKNLWVCRRPE